jgi:colanic acid/amylovoran biosynthesis glycosyltransferase
MLERSSSASARRAHRRRTEGFHLWPRAYLSITAMRPTITIATPASIESHGSSIVVDRKFHVGIERQASLLDARILCVAPEGQPPSLDRLECRRRDLAYEVVNADDAAAVDRALAESDLLYGLHLPAFRAARARGLPYVAVTEYSLGIRWRLAAITTCGVRGLVRRVRGAIDHGREQRALLSASAVHCNGYPAYRAARFARRRLLYLDSRMGADDVISAGALDARLSTIGGARPWRLLFSGRLEAIKGVLDLAAVAEQLARSRVKFVLDVYGDGSQRAAMEREIDRRELRQVVKLHGSIPYPELIGRVRSADLFVCCHPQGDPSCTYVETFGAGVPIAGYANEMWSALARESRGGVATPVGDAGALAAAIERLLGRPRDLERASRSARDFALAHNFDREFERRMDDLRPLLPRARTSAHSRASFALKRAS